MIKDLKEKALHYHEKPRAGKLTVLPSKSCRTVEEFSLAYTPGVAHPCLTIKANPEEAYRYTIKGNLVAVITNGTAVLGLGDIGPLAGKPTMEGNAVLFKRFANLDAFDLEIAEKDPQKFVDIVASLEPTFGGINLEDIKAPECFYIEEELIKRMNIPVIHDDQQGTAVIGSAALLNALEIVGKKISEVKIIISGAGAAAVAFARLLLEQGVKKEQIFMFDSEGLITIKRKLLNKYKVLFAQKQEVNFVDVFKGADVFIGVSKGNILTAKMIQSMADKPIVFAMANPIPEISYEEGMAARPDIIMATGRSDYPNQVNNVLGFPSLFRGALDVRARIINKEMKLAAVKALRELAHQKVPREVSQIYGKALIFGRDYILPKPFDPRVLYHVAPAVAKAAMESGVAGKKLNLDDYQKKLKQISVKLSKGKYD